MWVPVRIQVFDADGHFLTQWTGIGYPYGLWITPDQHVWMVDGGFDRIVELDQTGKSWVRSARQVISRDNWRGVADSIQFICQFGPSPNNRKDRPATESGSAIAESGASPHTDQSAQEPNPGSGRVVPKRPGDDLTYHYQWHGDSEHRVQAALNKEVAHNHYKHQAVYREVKPSGRQGEPVKSRVDEHAGGQEHQSPVELRALAPERSQHETRCEGDHIPQRNSQEIQRAMEMEDVETAHNDRRGHSHDRDGGADAKPC
jgi:hypothetical protein